MAARRNALGRGLGALIPEPAAPAPTLGASGAQNRESGRDELRVDRIVPNPQQPRRVFAAEELQQLADSIERYGLLQPVVVRKIPDSTPSRYELIVGERRWRAAQLAGLERIPVTIKDVAPQEQLEVALVENIQRQDLNPIELASAFRDLCDAGATQEQVAARVGLDRSTVANQIRLLDLPREMQEQVENGGLTAGHARALLQLQNPERRRHLRDRVLADQLSVRATEELARSLAGPGASRKRRAPTQADAVDPNLRHLLDSLRDQLKTRVRITGSATRGKIEIDFYGPEELHRLSRVLLEGPRGV